MQTYKNIFYFCCFLLSEPLNLMPLLSFLGITADALAPLLKECSDAQNTIMFAGAQALGFLHRQGVKIHVYLYFDLYIRLYPSCVLVLLVYPVHVEIRVLFSELRDIYLFIYYLKERNALQQTIYYCDYISNLIYCLRTSGRRRYTEMQFSKDAFQK